MDVADFISNLPNDERIIISKLGALLIDKEPRFREKLVLFGFCHGSLLSNAQELLLREGRKQVYIIRFSSINEINEKLLVEIFQEALIVNDLFMPKKELKKYE